MRIVPVDTKNGSSKKEAILKFGWSKNYGKALDDPNMKWTIRRFCAVVQGGSGLGYPGKAVSFLRCTACTFV